MVDRDGQRLETSGEMVTQQEKPPNTEEKEKDHGGFFEKPEERRRKLGPLVWEGASLGSERARVTDRTWRILINWLLRVLGWTQGGRSLGAPFLGGKSALRGQGKAQRRGWGLTCLCSLLSWPWMNCKTQEGAGETCPAPLPPPLLS